LRNLPKESLIEAGCSGFIGGHLVTEILLNGYSHIRTVDKETLDGRSQVRENAGTCDKPPA